MSTTPTSPPTPEQIDGKLQNLYQNLANHLGAAYRDIEPALQPLAFEYALNHDPAVRQKFLNLHNRRVVLLEIIKKVLEDKMLSADARTTIYKNFPDLEPKPLRPVGTTEPAVAAEAA